MKYVIDKKNVKEEKLMYYNVKMKGLTVSPKNAVPGLTIKAKKITFIDSELIKEYIKGRINRKIDKIVKFMLRILSDEDTGEDDSGLVIDEVNKLKGIIINKYKEYLTESEYKALLTKLILLEEEFQKNYNQKMYMNYVSNIYYEETNTKARGR